MRKHSSQRESPFFLLTRVSFVYLLSLYLSSFSPSIYLSSSSFLFLLILPLQSVPLSLSTSPSLSRSLSLSLSLSLSISLSRVSPPLSVSLSLGAPPPLYNWSLCRCGESTEWLLRLGVSYVPPSPP